MSENGWSDARRVQMAKLVLDGLCPCGCGGATLNCKQVHEREDEIRAALTPPVGTLEVDKNGSAHVEVSGFGWGGGFVATSALTPGTYYITKADE